MVAVILIVPPDEIALVEVAKVKRGQRSDWRGALEEPVAIWDGDVLAEVLGLIEQLPETDLTRCFAPAFGLRIHDESVARAEVLFCFNCEIALMIDLIDPRRDGGATFDSDSEPAQELLSRFRSCTADAADLSPDLLDANSAQPSAEGAMIETGGSV